MCEDLIYDDQETSLGYMPSARAQSPGRWRTPQLVSRFVADEVDSALNRLARDPTAASMRAVATAAPNATIQQLARLTQLLANSGECLSQPSPEVVDIASSGGPGSLSTLLAPLYARALGARIAKVAVPGRPAGGLDVLASLPGYESDLDASGARRILDECGYVHVEAGRAFCPLDAKFFIWRQTNGEQAVPNLAIASLLAKKVAAGVGRVVLDVRVGVHGNFGATKDDATTNARRLIAVASELGIRATCVLTCSEGVAQPWIGRGEALVALSAVLSGTAEGALRTHADDCLRMARIATDTDNPAVNTLALAPAATAANDAMLAAHGASPDGFWSRQHDVAAAPRSPIAADLTGWLQIDVAGIRRVLVDRQRSSPPPISARFPDPAGLKLEFFDSAAVTKGTVIALARDDRDPAHLAEQISPHLLVRDRHMAAISQPRVEIIDG